MTIAQPAESFRPLGADDFAAYWRGDVHFLMYGRITYRDIFGDVWDYGYAVRTYVRNDAERGPVTHFQDPKLGPKFSYRRKRKGEPEKAD